MDSAEIERRRQHQRQVLDELGVLSGKFLDYELDGLHKAGYTDVDDLKIASRDGLRRAGLREARIDQVTEAQGAAAALGAGSTGAGDTGAGLGPGGTAAGGLHRADTGAAVTSSDAVGLPANFKQMFTKLTQDTAAIRQAVHVVVGIQRTKFVYSASKATAAQRSGDFKKGLQDFYNNKTVKGKLRCMLLNVDLPKEYVIGPHMFKYCWREEMEVVLGLDCIDSARNGLLLFKPIEHAFGDSRICFSYAVGDGGQPTYTMVLLDHSLKGTTLSDYISSRSLPMNTKSIDSKVMSITFGELEGTKLVFTNKKYPYKRCLAFQAMMAMDRSRRKGWVPPGWSAPGTLSYASSDAEERMRVWLQGASNAGPPTVDESIEEASETSGASCSHLASGSSAHGS